MQDNDGRLLARLHDAGSYTSQGEVHAGDKLSISANFQLEILEHIPHAISNLSFVSDDPFVAPQGPGPIEPAALVEIIVGSISKQLWLRRNDLTYGQSAVALPGGVLALKFEPAGRSLGFSMTLIDSEHQPNTGSAKVRIADPQSSLKQEKMISKKQPLMHRGFIVFPSLSEPTPHGTSSTTFAVTYDPGLNLKYFGGLLGILGVALSLVSRYWFAEDSAHEPLVEQTSKLEYGKAA